MDQPKNTTADIQRIIEIILEMKISFSTTDQYEGKADGGGEHKN